MKVPAGHTREREREREREGGGGGIVSAKRREARRNTRERKRPCCRQVYATRRGLACG